jgi:hypothetical protein
VLLDKPNIVLLDKPNIVLLDKPNIVLLDKYVGFVSKDACVAR